MADRHILYKLQPAIAGQNVADAESVEVDNTSLPLLTTDVQGSLAATQSQIDNIIVPTPPSFRPFRTFTGGTLVSNINFRIEEISLDATNLAVWNDINNIYAAGRVNKRVDILLPTDTEIAAAGLSYPIAIEVTHMGGTARTPADGRPNVVNLIIKDVDTATNIDTVRLGERKNTSLLMGDVSLVVKDAAGGDWTESTRVNDPSENLLPSGVFDLQEDMVINNIANLSTELSGVAVITGEAFQVITGGTYFGGREVGNNSVVVAITDNPSLTDVNTNDDWIIIPNAASTAVDLRDRQLLNQFTQNGVRFDASRNVFVNESNVISFSSMASNTPLTNVYFDAGQDTPSRSRTFANQALQFTDLQGGTLSLTISFTESQSSGFLPELTSLVLTYGVITFTFPLTNISASGGSATINLTIPNADYSSILNSNCDITLNYIFRGANFIGSFTILGLVNTLDGTLRQSVTDIANTAASAVEGRLQSQLTEIQGGVDDNEATFASINPRLSPLRTEGVNTPVQGALFGDSTGSDGAPSDLGTLTTVNPNNPRFPAATTSVFIAVPIVQSRSNFVVLNVTQNSIVPLNSGNTLASTAYQGQTYFIYRISGVTVGDLLEVNETSTVEVVAWQEDIDELEREVDQLQNTAVDLPDAVRNVLENDTTVTEQTVPTLVASSFNTGLGSGGTQKIFTETSPQTPSSGTLQSDPFSDTASGNRARRKLVYIGTDHVYSNAVLLNSFDGVSTNFELVRYMNNELLAQVFVPAQSATTVNTVIYPSPSNRVSGAGIWQTIETLTFRNGIPTAESDELFFTRNVPSQVTTLTIQYRGHANGNIFGAGSAMLANVGGSTDSFTTFIISDGSEIAMVEVRYYANFQNRGRAIRVSVTERVNTGLPTINDVQVILSYTESRAVPATPATVREVVIETHATTGISNVIGIKEVGGNVVIVGDQHEVDLNRTWTSVFGATEAGNLIVFSEDAAFYDYQDITITNTTVASLESHSDQPNFGLFETNYNHESTLELSTGLEVQRLNIANIPTSASGLSSGDIWNNSGVLNIVP